MPLDSNINQDKKKGNCRSTLMKLYIGFLVANNNPVCLKNTEAQLHRSEDIHSPHLTSIY